MFQYESRNPYVLKFKKAAEMLKQNPRVQLQIVIETNRGNDKRRYNYPTTSEIAVLTRQEKSNRKMDL